VLWLFPGPVDILLWISCVSCFFAILFFLQDVPILLTSGFYFAFQGETCFFITLIYLNMWDVDFSVKKIVVERNCKYLRSSHAPKTIPVKILYQLYQLNKTSPVHAMRLLAQRTGFNRVKNPWTTWYSKKSASISGRREVFQHKVTHSLCLINIRISRIGNLFALSFVSYTNTNDTWQEN
jgi:uncharacterized membrane protein